MSDFDEIMRQQCNVCKEITKFQHILLAPALVVVGLVR